MDRMTMGRKKKLALIAHDHKKNEIIEWSKFNKDVLKEHYLYGTGTTGTLISKATGLDVYCFKSGPFGGDQQIGAKIAEGELDLLFFFWDPLEPLPHDPDIKALLRIAAVYNIPIACNKSSADFLISSPLMDEVYEREIEKYEDRKNNKG